MQTRQKPVFSVQAIKRWRDDIWCVCVHFNVEVNSQTKFFLRSITLHPRIDFYHCFIRSLRFRLSWNLRHNRTVLLSVSIRVLKKSSMQNYHGKKSTPSVFHRISAIRVWVISANFNSDNMSAFLQSIVRQFSLTRKAHSTHCENAISLFSRCPQTPMR